MKTYRAIKCIPKSLARQSSLPLEEALYHEADLLKNLSHPGIPLIYDIDDDDDHIYMIEEFIQGESLDAFVLHQEDLSPKLIINIGIQLCDILDYLHHLMPCPILHQDLKPEHIILCGNQVKIIDFGIASFFSGFGKHFQIYGSKAYAAPEALKMLPCDTSSDIYSVGRVLEFLSDHVRSDCPSRLLALIGETTAECPAERPQSAASLKSSLCDLQEILSSSSSHLIRNIAVVGTRHGAGSTHIAIAATCSMNRSGYSAVYKPEDSIHLLEDLSACNPNIREHNGIYSYRSFKGVPDYGSGVELPVSDDDCIIHDFGFLDEPADALALYDLILVVVSASDWDLSAILGRCRMFSLLPQSVFICNFGRKDMVRKLARLIGKPVWCFPFDIAPFKSTKEKDRIISAILQKKGGILH